MSMTHEHRSSRDTASRRGRFGRFGGLGAAALCAASVLAVPRAAHAEDVKPTGKGIVGCALLGGEVVVFGEAIFGVRSTAAYLIGAGAGMVGGGVGGYFLEQGVSDGRIPAYTLAGGLALVIPALVVALDQTRYMPAEGAREDKPANLPPSNPGQPSGSTVIGAEPPAAAPAPATPAPATTPTPGQTPSGATTPPTPPSPGGAGAGGTQAPITKAPLSFLDVHEGAWRVGMPVPEVRPMFTKAEEKQFAVQGKGTVLRFPVVNVTF